MPELAKKINYYDSKHTENISKKQEELIPKEEDRIFVFSDKESDVTDYLANLKGTGIIDVLTEEPSGELDKDYIKVQFAPYIKRHEIEDNFENEGSREIFRILGLETIQDIKNKTQKNIDLLDIKYGETARTIYVKLNKNFKSKIVHCGDLTSFRNNLGIYFPPLRGLQLNSNVMWHINDWLASQKPNNYISIIGNHETSFRNNTLFEGQQKDFCDRFRDRHDYRKLSYTIKNDNGQYLIFSHTGAVEMDKIKNALKRSNSSEYIEYIEDNDVEDCLKENHSNNICNRLWVRDENYHDGVIQDLNVNTDNNNRKRPAMNEGIHFHGHNYIYNAERRKECNSNKGYFNVNDISHRYYMIDKNDLSKIYACDNGIAVNTIKTEIKNLDKKHKKDIGLGSGKPEEEGQEYSKGFKIFICLLSILLPIIGVIIASIIMYFKEKSQNIKNNTPNDSLDTTANDIKI